MAQTQQTVYDKRKYGVLNTSDAKKVAYAWLESLELEKAIIFGLPEADDRYHHWRVPLLGHGTSHKIGEVCIDAYTTLVLESKSTKKDILEARLLGRNGKAVKKSNKPKAPCIVSSLRNTIALGDSEEILQELPAQSVDLVITSPPYYNARPDYVEYLGYEEYLLKLRKIIQNTHRVLNEGRFFVMNIAPVLQRRASRGEASKRIAVPFDVHALFIKEGFDFIEDIIWVKPEGAGWATGRGRRFAADRSPLQYKAVPVTEYILVYRKHTDKLIDWNIRNHPDQEAVERSKIKDDYEKTNIWRITPAHTKKHPAIFPDELVEKVLRYYSFENDVVLDPFGGIGTVGRVASRLNRRFVLIEREPEYVSVMQAEAHKWLGQMAENINYINCEPQPTTKLF